MIVASFMYIYVDTDVPFFSLFGFIVLHMLMYSANIYFWKRYRVNYTFMLGFKQGTELGYWQVLFLSSGLAVITLACVLSNLDMDADPRTRTFAAITESVPLALLTVSSACLKCFCLHAPAIALRVKAMPKLNSFCRPFFSYYFVLSTSYFVPAASSSFAVHFI